MVQNVQSQRCEPDKDRRLGHVCKTCLPITTLSFRVNTLLIGFDGI